MARAGHTPPEIHLPPLFRPCRAGARAGARRTQRAAGRSGHCARGRLQVRRHTRFYRQSEIYARQGIRFDRATLGNWSGRACFHLQPITNHMADPLPRRRASRARHQPGRERHPAGLPNQKMRP
ncbi:transposase [Bradyrhizobium yuanmingense]|nr:transposase [Bradyrhizobium yuanmingense]MDF0522279.1 transposase [Bradyrhizobium yuanmingense]